MRLKNNKSGFTLLEIIIVIIIVGVLASLALPRFFATVEFSKSAEALQAMAFVRSSMERCYLAAGGTYNPASGCTIANIDVANPGTAPGARFVYLVGSQSATGYTIRATRNLVDGGDGVSNITLTQSAAGVTRMGTGVYVGIK